MRVSRPTPTLKLHRLRNFPFDSYPRTRGGETDRLQLARVVILIFEAFNTPLIERDQDDALATLLA